MAKDVNSGDLQSLATHRAAYIRSAEKKLAEKRKVLELVKRKVRSAQTSGRIVRSQQLVNAERKANECLLEAENQLIRLGSDADNEWENSRFKTDIAIEELSNSVKQMVARFT